MSELRKIIQNLADKGLDDAVMGRVKCCQELTPAGWKMPERLAGFWCDVDPEKESESLLQNVPVAMRVLNTDDDIGVIFVPKVDTTVLIEWVDGRPTITACQEWTRMILKKGDNFWLEVKANDDIFVKTAGAVEIKVAKTVTEEIDIFKQVKSPLIKLGKTAPHPVIWGDSLVSWLSTHTHGSSPPPLQAPALPALLSKVVFTD